MELDSLRKHRVIEEVPNSQKGTHVQGGWTEHYKKFPLCSLRHLLGIPALADGRGSLCVPSQDRSVGEAGVLLAATTSSERDAQSKQADKVSWLLCLENDVNDILASG